MYVCKEWRVGAECGQRADVEVQKERTLSKEDSLNWASKETSIKAEWRVLCWNLLLGKKLT